jgi:NAD(P)-dependent dehydrogenase (short-subunit alcohol dehydrogenase family)
MSKNNVISKLFDVRNKNIVITGSAGLLGSQFELTLTKSGANVILVDIDSTNNNKLVKLLSKYNSSITQYQTDISELSDVQNLKNSLKHDFRQIHGLVNCAAYTTKASLEDTTLKHGQTFENFSLANWEKSIKINLTGTFLCCQQIGNLMARQKSGVIVNISSIYGLVGADHRIYGKSGLNVPASYAATKSSIINFTRYLAAYWHKQNVRVNTLSLGGVMDKKYQNADFIKKYSEKTILGRMAKKNDFDGALLFLLSDASSYMTGSNLVIDGGWTAW